MLKTSSETQPFHEIVRRANCFARLGLFVLLILITLVNAFEAKAVDCIPSPPGLIGWWSADGNGLDRVGTNNAFLFGAATATNAGFNDRGFRFDGTNSHVAVSNSPQVNLATLTVECWVRFDMMDTPGTSTAGSQYMVFKKNLANSIFEGINLSKHRYTNSEIFVWEASNASQFTELRSITVIQQGVWYHTAGVRGSNYLALFVNGVLERSNAVSYPQQYDTKPLFFGCSGEPYWEHKLGGMMDEIGLYNRALTGAEIAAIYAAGAAGRCKPTAPVITSQPTNQIVLAGNPASFSVAASGGNMGYQWRMYSTNLPGQLTNTLLIPAAQSANAGDYSVVLSNSLGMATSSVATLTVLIPPYITVPPASQTVLIGGTANFSVAADGSGPLNYQWKFNTTNLLGQNFTNLTVANVQLTDAGSYSVLITGPGGSTNSAAVSLAVIQHPVLLSPQGGPPFAFTLSGDAGHTYAIEVTTNFQNWSELTTVSNATGQVGVQDLTSSNQVTRYYRARFVQ